MFPAVQASTHSHFASPSALPSLPQHSSLAVNYRTHSKADIGEDDQQLRQLTLILTNLKIHGLYIQLVVLKENKPEACSDPDDRLESSWGIINHRHTVFNPDVMELITDHQTLMIHDWTRCIIKSRGYTR